MKKLLKQFSAWIPLFMSASAFLLLVVYILFFGTMGTTNSDEGSAARLFQLLIVFQIPFIYYFVSSNYKKRRKATFKVLGIQITAILIAVLSVIIAENML